MDHYLQDHPLCGLYISEDQNGICAGFATIGALGTKGWVCELSSDSTHPYAVIDKILHLLFVASGKKIVVSASSMGLYETLKHHFGSYEVMVDVPSLTLDEQNRVFQEVFSLRSLLTPVDHLNLEASPLASMALALAAMHLRTSCFLPLIPPNILRMDGLLQLGNNPLEQLEMVPPDPRDLTIAKLFLTMRTEVGKKLGRFRFGLPTIDIHELNERYDVIERVASQCDYMDQELGRLEDIAQLWSHMRRDTVWNEKGESLCRGLERLADLSDYLHQHRIEIGAIEGAEIRDWCREFRINHHRLQWLAEQNAFIGSVLSWIAIMDVAVTSAMVAKRYALCRPLLIETKKDESFIQAMGLRHLLVEMQGISYVPNDIVMGNREYLDLPYPDTVMLDSAVHDGADISGVLLYGINSSGKSSLMKSIGIAVVLAQGGFFVPAKAMKFSPFNALYTRILSRDNVVKSLSTFGVEMLELNSIFHKATPKTLILGDEISHGTETLSAVAIVASTILELARQNALFILTTHLHQLSMVKELSQLRSVVSLHLSVHYDESIDQLIYDRRLRAGRGSSVYGLEFAESLHMHKGFLANAKRLRENLAKEYDVLELSHKQEYLKRYSQVVACECVICGALIKHRISPQKRQQHHHLIPLCDTHARHIVEGKINVTQIIMTPQGLRLDYETQLQG
ncbi:MAG TPA: hypothetical protein VFX57_06135 [Sulfuricurvum sp.]|nr:hypothetical protein [Sulfuricurvum sp.]